MDITLLSNQLFGFLFSLAAGIVLGAAYDCLRFWRILFHSGKRAIFFQDVFYMAAAAFFTFLVALGIRKGEVRAFILLGEAGGWFAYYFTLGRLTVRLFKFFSHALHRFVFRPAAAILRKITVLFQKLFVWTLKKAGKLLQIGKKRLKLHRKVVYNFNNKQKAKRRKHQGRLKGIVRGYENHPRS